jgi:hypothetical protein
MEKKSKSALTTGHVVRRWAEAFVEPVILAAQILWACLSDAM